MRILFVTDVFDLYVKRDPLGILYLSATLKSHGHETYACASHLKNMILAVDQFRPEVVAYSVTHPSFGLMQRLNVQLKNERPGAFLSVFGGPHATFSPESIEAEGIDAMCVGEGEEALADLVDRIQNGVSIDDTPNWWIKKPGVVIKNDVRPLMIDLDAVPFPDRDLLAATDPQWRSYPVRSFLQSRGCPYNCTFCHNRTWRRIYKDKGEVLRTRSVENLVAEVEQVKARYGLQFVLFTADTFILSQDWLERFAEVFPKQVGLPFFCMVRADLIDESMAGLLKKAGAFSVGMGIESGDADVRRKILHKGAENDLIIRAARLVHNAGINLYTFNMLGIPGTDFRSDIDTLDLNIAIGSDYPLVTMATPYPNTELFDMARNTGWLEEGAPSYNCSYYEGTILDFPHKNRSTNLMYLFALAVRFTILRGLVLKMTRVNLPGIYGLIHRLIKGYYSWRRVFPHRLEFKDFFRSAGRYLFGVHR